MPQAKRGELWLIDLGIAQKTRPCVVLSIEYLDHERAVVSYVPRTTVPAKRGSRFHILRPDSTQAHSMLKELEAYRL